MPGHNGQCGLHDLVRRSPVLADKVVLPPRELVKNGRSHQRHRAYELWEQNGKPEGRDQEFYHQVEKELKEAPPPEPTGLPE
jgi:hypothetical protein